MRVRSSLTCQVVILVTVACVFASGCMRTRVDMVAKYQPGTPSKVDRAPDVGVYKIKYTTADDEDLHTLRGSKRFLGKGQPLGFERGESGEIIAIAGEERFPALLPDGARFCVWYTKSEEPTEFGQGLGDAMTVVGVGTLVVGGLIVLAILSDDDDCRHGFDRDDCRFCCD